MVCAIVCAAVALEAATFTWTTESEQYMPSTWGKKEAGDGQAAATSGSTKTITKWAENGMAFTAAILLSTDNATWTPSAADVAVSSDAGMISVEGVDNSLWPNPMADKTLYYKVVVTGTYTDDKGTWTATGTIGGNGEYVSLTSMDPDYLTTAPAGSWDISFQGAGPVPEPTSGLMLLLGVGALALRRKQK